MFEKLKSMLVEQGEAIASFRAKVDDRLDEMGNKLREVEKHATRPQMGGGGGQVDILPGDRAKVSQALRSFIRSGDQTHLAEIRQGMRVGSDPDGGYVVLPVLSPTIRNRVREISPIRGIARVVELPVGFEWKEPFETTETGATWVGEADTRGETDAPKLGELTIMADEVYALVSVTQRLLDDARMDISAWVGERIAEKFGRTEGAAFINGNGVAKPRGLLNYPVSTASDGTRAFGTLQYLVTGASGAFKTSDTPTAPADILIDMVASLKAAYRANARWVMNRRTEAVVRKLKDADGKHLWQAGLTEGAPNRLLGYPVELAEDMPDVAADSYSIAFGDFRRGYTVVDHVGMRMLTDPYSSKPNVLLYAYRRIGGGLSDSEAIKLLKFGTS